MFRFRTGLVSLVLGAAVLNVTACSHQRKDPIASAPVPPQAAPSVQAGAIEVSVDEMPPVSRPNFASLRIVNIVEETREEPAATRLVVAGSAAASRDTFRDVYRLSLDLRKGDIVKLEAQVELTNDLAKNVLVAAQFRTPTSAETSRRRSAWFGPISSQNITPDVHHLPVTAASLYQVPSDGVYTFAISVRAASEVAARGDTLIIERGHGRLLATVYRPE